MNKLSKGTLILTIGVFVLGAAAGAGVTYLAVDKDSKTDNSQQSDGAPATDRPEITEDKTEPDTSVPAGTLSPTTVVNDYKNYTGKEITLNGMLVKLPDGSYLLSGKETRDQRSIVAKFEGNGLKIDEYISVYAGDNSTPPKGTFKAVSAKGKVSETDGKPVFTASELSN